MRGAALARQIGIGGEVFKSWFMVLSEWAVTEHLHLHDQIIHLEAKLRHLLVQDSVRQDESLAETLRQMLVRLRTNKAQLLDLEEIDRHRQNPIHNENRRRYTDEIQDIAIRVELEVWPQYAA